MIRAETQTDLIRVDDGAIDQEQLDEINSNIDDAAKTATDYISDLGTDDGFTVQGTTSATNGYVKVTDIVEIGSSNGKAQVSTDGLVLFDTNSNELSSFRKNYARVGSNNGYVEIRPDSLTFMGQDTSGETVVHSDSNCGNWTLVNGSGAVYGTDAVMTVGTDSTTITKVHGSVFAHYPEIYCANLNLESYVAYSVSLTIEEAYALNTSGDTPVKGELVSNPYCLIRAIYTDGTMEDSYSIVRATDSGVCNWNLTYTKPVRKFSFRFNDTWNENWNWTNLYYEVVISNFKVKTNGNGNLLENASFSDTNAQITATQIDLNGDVKYKGLELIDLFYPVGSYYETSDTTFNPNTVWSGTTWVLETEGQVHVSGAASGTYVVNKANDNNGAGAKDGGEASHNITENEMPRHRHGAPSSTYDAFMVFNYGTVNTGLAETRVAQASSGSRYAVTNTNSNFDASYSMYTAYTGHGADNAMSLMQPYIVVNRWHRTA